jgi:hypothetical protein
MPMGDDLFGPITHPDELRGGFSLRIGNIFEMKSEGRITPAGIVAAGFATAIILLATAAVVRAARRR